jgi:hypothetical protein
VAQGIEMVDRRSVGHAAILGDDPGFKEAAEKVGLWLPKRRPGGDPKLKRVLKKCLPKQKAYLRG